MGEPGLGDWIAKVEKDSNDRHSENIQRITTLEAKMIAIEKSGEERDKKLDQIIDILNQSRGVVNLIKMTGIIAGALASIALIYEVANKFQK